MKITITLSQEQGLFFSIRNIAILFLVGLGSFTTISAQSTWTIRSPLYINHSLNSVVWDGSMSVAVGDSGSIETSADGAAWLKRTSGVTTNLTSICYSGKLLVAVGDSGTVLTSPDGITWTSRASHTLGYMEGVVWGNNQFIAFGFTAVRGANSWIYHWVKITSADGITWNDDSSDTTNVYSSIAWTGSQFVAADNGKIITSPDGVTWTSHTTRYPLSVVRWTGKTIIGISGPGYFDNKIAYSNDGASWKFDTLPNYNAVKGHPYDVAAHGDTIVAAGYAGGICMSYDNGATWKIRLYTPYSTVEDNFVFSSIACTDGQFILVGSYSNHSRGMYGGCAVTSCAGDITAIDSNGAVVVMGTFLDWKDRTVSGPILGDLHSVTSTGAQIVAVGDYGTILTSQDGIVWANRSDTGITKQPLWSVLWSGTKFVAVGDEGTVVTSKDGITWTKALSGTTDLLKSVAWTGKQFVAVGGSFSGNSELNYDRVLTSPDAITWTDRGQPGDGIWNSVIWTGSQLMAVGEYRNSSTPYSSVVYTSPDGVTWTDQDARFQYMGLSSVACDGHMFVAVGGSASHLSLASSDGLKWADGGLGSGTYYYYCVVWANNRFVSVGKYGRIETYSIDSTWELHNPVIGTTLYSVTCTGTQFVAVGANGTIITSPLDNSAINTPAIPSRTAEHISVTRLPGNRITIRISGIDQAGSATFQVFDVFGKCLQQTVRSMSAPEDGLPLNDLASGRYFLRVKFQGTTLTCPFLFAK
jgi:hypothetical protein